jgi:hypothetical protein
MKLLELTGIKNLSDKEITDIITELIKKKYKLLGVGMCGVAFDNPKKPNEVIKFWFNDPGYEHFLIFAQSIKSPHIIKVIKRGSITLNLDTPIIIKYARLEKLTPFIHHGKPEKIDNINLESFTHILNLTLHLPVDEFIEGFYFKFNSIYGKFEQPKLSKETINFMHVVKQIHDKLHEFETWDLHAENRMKRGNTLVITDPYSSYDAEAIDKNKKLFNFLFDLEQ